MDLNNLFNNNVIELDLEGQNTSNVQEQQDQQISNLTYDPSTNLVTVGHVPFSNIGK